MGDLVNKRDNFHETLFARTDDLGIDRSHISLIEEANMDSADPKSPMAAVFFGYKGADDAAHPKLSALLANSIAIIPCVGADESVTAALPKSIGHINAFSSHYAKSDWERIVSLLLENLRLLRSERRLFISYRRSESQSVAIQLYESFDKAGFDVFLDTRSVPYGADFQSILWHRMADSDVVVLLDTPNFRASYWTQQELSQANATNVQIMHLLASGLIWVPFTAHLRFSNGRHPRLQNRRLRSRAAAEVHRAACSRQGTRGYTGLIRATPPFEDPQSAFWSPTSPTQAPER
jgi:hypothetical protein